MAEDFKALIKEQKETNKKLGQLVSSSSNEPSGAAAKEEQQESAAAAKNQTNLLKKIAGGVTGMFGKMGEKVKGAGKGIMAMLKGTLVAGLLLAVLAFLESKYWTDTKDFIVNTIVPAITKFWGYISALGPIFKKYFVDTWANIKELFSGLGDAFDLFSQGEWWEGIKTFFSSIGTFIGKQIDTIATAVYNIVAHIFGLSKTDSVYGSIWGFLTDTYDEIVSWIKITWFNIKTTISQTFTNIKNFFVDTFNFISDGIAKTWTGVTNFIKGVWDSVVTWFSKLWTWTEGTIAGTWTGVSGFIKEVWDSVVTWFSKLWTWGEGAIAGDFKGVTTFITDMFGKVKTWFTNLFTWSTTVDDKDSLVVKTIKTAVDAVKIWLGNMFKFDSASAIITSAFNVVTFLPNLILTGLREVSKWLLSLFGFDKAAQAVANTDNWTIGSMVVTAFKAIKKWFVGLFNWKKAEPKEGEKQFSISQMISDLWRDITTALTDIMPSLDDLKAMLPSPGELLSKLNPFSSDDDDDKKKGNAKAAGGPFGANQPMIVGELGPELILPSSGGQVVNAERTSQIQAAGLRRGAGSSGGAPAVVNAPVNTINNSQSNTTVTSTELKHPSAILNSVNLAA